jgi:hypothetical protein
MSFCHKHTGIPDAIFDLVVGNHPKTYLSKHPPELTASTSSTPQA